jgi:hypothetical protein
MEFKPALRLVRAARIAVAGTNGVPCYSLFGSMQSLFGEKDSLLRSEQGIFRRLFESLEDLTSAAPEMP